MANCQLIAIGLNLLISFKTDLGEDCSEEAGFLGLQWLEVSERTDFLMGYCWFVNVRGRGIFGLVQMPSEGHFWLGLNALSS